MASATLRTWSGVAEQWTEPASSKRTSRVDQRYSPVVKASSQWARSALWNTSTSNAAQPLTAPIVNPAMNRSRKRLKTMAMGSATNTADACSDCQKNTSPRTNAVGTPTLIGLFAVDEMNDSA